MKSYRFKDNARKTLAGILLLSASVAGATQAQQVTGFEGSTFSPGSVVGDAGIQTTYFTIAPPEGTHQALLTTVSSANDPGYPIGTSGTSTGATSIAAIQSLINYSGGINNAGSNGREGSAFAVSVSLSTGSIISFSYDFLTSEGTNNDFAFVTLTNASGTSSVGLRILSTANTVNASGTPTDISNPYYYQQSGYQRISLTAPSAGTFTLGFGVVDVTTTDTPSALLIDNITVTVPETSSVISVMLLGIALLATRRVWQKRQTIVTA